MMTNRENIISLIKRRGYERMPIEFALCPYLNENYGEELQQFVKDNEITECVVRSKAAILQTFDRENYKKYYQVPLKDNAVIDELGVGHEPGSEAAMHMTYMRHPMEHMETLEQLKAYPLPTIENDPQYLEMVKEENEKYKADDKFIIGDMQVTIWERSWYLRSMERLMMDMLCEEELAEFILDKITNMAIKQALFYVEAGVDALFFGDDIGMQKTTLMSDEMYVTWLKPRLKYLIDTVKLVNPNIIIYYHSCGFVEPFIQHLIDVGVDVLNPVQPECMDFAGIHEKYGNQISFHGTIGTQTTMPFGTPEEVRESVFRNLDIAGEKGGLLVCPSHLLEPEVPLENIKAYLLACNDYTKS